MLKKYSEYEIVKVILNEIPRLKKVYGKKGTVLGFTTDEFGNWYYGVMFDDGVISIKETYLESTGKFTSEKEIYDGEKLKISVDSYGFGRMTGEEKDDDSSH